MRHLTAVCVLMAISTHAIPGESPASMSWEYLGADANVRVVLKANGECAVIASLARRDIAQIVECTYSIREPYVWLNWKHEIYGHRPFPSRLMLVGDGEFMRVHGESQRMLRRTSEAR